MARSGERDRMSAMRHTILAIVLGSAATVPATATEQRIEAEGTANAATVVSDWAWGGKAASSGTAWDALGPDGQRHRNDEFRPPARQDHAREQKC
jgi:hypothetical protein